MSEFSLWFILFTGLYFAIIGVLDHFADKDSPRPDDPDDNDDTQR
jgi:hypothetical protein